MTSAPVTIVECPRDAWQAMPRQIPAAVKANYLRALVDAGFGYIDAVSFVSPAVVPQMADAETVLALLGPVPGVDIIGIVVNQRGAERAIRTGAVSTLGFPYSISPTFLERNQKQTIEEARRTLAAIGKQAASAGLGVVTYVSMAFGNPYGDRWQPEAVVTACRTLQDMGLNDISLADTVGLAGPAEIVTLLSTVLAETPGIRLGAHLHARPDQVAAKVAAAYQAGCRRLDMALGGLGGCPFAQDALVGNIATELALAQLRSCDARLPVLQPLDQLLAMSSAIADRFGAAA
jgi:hydroxymethylglutaryl-CoA lyase